MQGTAASLVTASLFPVYVLGFDIPANDPPCIWERLQGEAEVPAMTLTGLVVLVVGILSVIISRTIRRKR